MRLESLTFLRFLAAIIVVVFHYGRNIEGVRDLPSIFYAGPQMVTFFFVLSGFVMAMAHYGKDFSAKVFYIKRLSRIAPLYLLALALYFVFSSALVSEHERQVLFHLLFVQSWLPPHALSLNGPAWSLSVEAFFYVIFPLVFMAFKGGGRSLIIAAIAWALTQAVQVNLFEAGFYKGFPSISHSLTYYFPPVHVSSFLLGYAGGSWFLENQGKVIWHKKESIVLPVAGLISIGLVMQYASLIGHKLGITLPVAASFLSPFFLVLILCFACSHNFITVILSKRPARILGDASFGIYILQKPLYIFYMKNISPALGIPKLASFLAFVAFLILVAIIVYLIFERPVNQFVRRYLTSRAPGSVTKVPSPA